MLMLPMRDGTSEDRATQLLICELLSFAIFISRHRGAEGRFPHRCVHRGHADTCETYADRCKRTTLILSDSFRTAACTEGIQPDVWRPTAIV